MTLRSYLRIFRERVRIILFITMLGAAIAVLVTALTPKQYEASAQIFVSSNGDVVTNGVGQYDQQAAAVSQVTTFADLIGTPKVISAVRADLDLNLSDSALRAKLTATAPPQQTLVIISATDGSSDRAAAIANSAATAFIRVIEDLKKPSDSDKSTVRLFQTSQAIAPSSPESPKPVLNIVLGVVLGLLLGAAAAVARDVLDNRIKDADSLAKVSGHPAMGIIVHDPEASRHTIASRAGARNVRAENFRQLRANLQFADVDHHPRVIAITSSVPTEGKTMVAVNLASTLAEAGFRVCLIDADLRRPSIAKTLGLSREVGLTNLLINQVALKESLQDLGSNLSVLTSGPTPPNPSEILASTYVREVVHSLLESFDYIVLDTAPLLPVADGSEVAALSDGTLLVARHEVATDPQVRRSVATLKTVNARILGVVLNDVPRKGGEYGYGYTYAYDRKPPEASRTAPKLERRSRAARHKHDETGDLGSQSLATRDEHTGVSVGGSSA